LPAAEGRGFQDALRTFFQPIKNADARLDSCMMYREATGYDTDYLKNYGGDLDATLIFVYCVSSTAVTCLTRLRSPFTAVISAFAIDLHPILQPDPNEQSATLLSLCQSAIPGEIPTVPPVQVDPPNEIITVTGLMYASLLISSLATFIAMLGKQ
jgi:hypothetical protein